MPCSRIFIPTGVFSSCPPLQQLTEAEQPVKSDWRAHQKNWQSFWERSHIFVTSCGSGDVNLNQYRFMQFPTPSDAYVRRKLIPAEQNAFQLSQRYALERFCEAAASRGADDCHRLQFV